MLYVLALSLSSPTVVTQLHLERLGHASAPSTLCYLDNGVVFLGSCSGDSQVREGYSKAVRF
jgi:DNA damage-binding protein 1